MELKVSPEGGLVKAVVKAVAISFVTGAVSALFSHTRNQVERKITTSFTANRSESALTYALIAKWLVRDGLLNVDRHATVSSFYSEDEDERGDTTVRLPPHGTYYSRYKGVRVRIDIKDDSGAAGGAHRGKEPIIRVVALNDTKMVLMTKIRTLLRDELATDRLRIEEIGSGRFVVKAKRDISAIVLPKATRSALISHLDWWVSSRDMYDNFGITYKTGILLEGPPGTGKSSLAQAIASYLDMPLIIMSASDAGFRSSTVRKNSVILIEDIDRESVAAKRGSKAMYTTDPATTENSDETEASSEPSADLADLASQNLVGKLLNVLDGAASPDGVVFILSTNHPDRIDPALLRPGRIDLRLHLDYFDEYGAMELGTRFGVASDHVMALGEDTWREPAKLQLALMQFRKNMDVAKYKG